MGVIIRNGIEYSGTGGGNIVYLTQEEYDALPETKLSNGVEYRITDANTSNTVARNISYDNSESGIDAVNVQGAIDKVSESLGDLKFGYDTETQKYGYYVTDSEGADTFFPFSSVSGMELLHFNSTRNPTSAWQRIEQTKTLPVRRKLQFAGEYYTYFDVVITTEKGNVIYSFNQSKDANKYSYKSDEVNLEITDGSKTMTVTYAETYGGYGMALAFYD